VSELASAEAQVPAKAVVARIVISDRDCQRTCTWAQRDRYEPPAFAGKYLRERALDARFLAVSTRWNLKLFSSHVNVVKMSFSHSLILGQDDLEDGVL
jgi:hypothetical protein